MHILNMRCTFLPIVTIFLPVIWAWGLIKVLTTVFRDSLLKFLPHCFSRFVTGYFWRNYVWEVVESVPGWGGGILLLTVGKLKTKQSTQHLLQIFVPGEFDKKPPQKGPLWHHFGTWFFSAVLTVTAIARWLSRVWLWAKGNRRPASLRENFATPSTNYLEGLNLGLSPRIIVIPRNKLNFSGPSAWQNKHLIFRLSTLSLTILWLTLLSLKS